MAVQSVENGKLVDTSASGNTSKIDKNKKEGSTLGKEAFLQLLVAQMQYQDPLQPTNNTEYIAQLATFSQLEATQNLENTMNKNLGSSLVGKFVIVQGPVGPITGKVDYTMVQDDKVYLAVEDGLYLLDDLDTVVDKEYFDASRTVMTFTTMMGKMPDPKYLTIQDEEKIKEARKYYDSMTAYQQQFVSKDDLAKLEKLEEKMKELKPEKPKPEEPKPEEPKPDGDKDK